MYRNIMNDLMEWYEKGQDKILLLQGAKGVGKTWTVMDFAYGFYDNPIYIDFETDEEAGRFFRSGERVGVPQLIRNIGVHCGAKYRKGKTIYIFDEAHIQPKTMAAIVRMKKQRPEIPICVIASTMKEITTQEDFFYPLKLYPLSFEEFLIANKEQDLCELVEKQKLEPIPEAQTDKLMEYLKVFYLIGGMPAVVQDFIDHHEPDRSDMILKDLLAESEKHITRYAPAVYLEKIKQIWNSIPAQMEKENRKFMYQYVDEKARAREYEKSVNWLVDTGLVRKVNRLKNGSLPIEEQIDEKSFELYHLDHGLLRVMCGLSYDSLAEDPLLEDVNGALIEQYVLAELTVNSRIGQLGFWISGATARVEFVFEEDGEIIPAIVQPHIRRKAQNIKIYRSRNDNLIAMRISLDSLSFEKGLINVPLYGLWNF